MSFRWKFYDADSHVGSLFKHVGVNLRLYEGTSAIEVTYPRVRTGYVSSIFDDLARGWEQTLLTNWTWNPLDYLHFPTHSTKEYAERLDANKPILKTMSLNALYCRKDVVGNLVADF